MDLQQSQLLMCFLSSKVLKMNTDRVVWINLLLMLHEQIKPTLIVFICDGVLMNV
jgi:hypothetical protein